MEKIRVVVADDHPAFREGLYRLLEGEKDLAMVGQASDGEGIINLSRDLKPDVAIVDMAMPKMTGIEVTKGIKEASPKTAVLIFSAFNNEAHILDSLRAGAAGYLTKDTSMSELVSAVRLAYSGESVIDRGVANSIIRNIIRGQDGKGNVELFPREIEVLKLAARGMRNKEIAKELNVSDRNPDPKLISTSYVERQNLTMRIGMRRFTRLTNAFSKKLENHIYALALYFMHYNFARTHKTLANPYPRTPAMAAGLANHVWTVEEIVKLNQLVNT